MNKYIIRVDEGIKAQVKISVLAENAPAGIRIVNRALRKNGNVLIGATSSLDEFPPVEWMMHLSDIDENIVIIEDAVPPLADDLLDAYRFLETAGYNYQGKDGEDSLATDETPLFTKPVWTENEAGVDSFLHVRATYESESGVYKFQIEAILYPTGRGELERGEAPFRARFQDKQYFISAKELPLAIEVYERMFIEFIKLLRVQTISFGSFHR